MLWKRYDPRIAEEWASKVYVETKRRIVKSQGKNNESLPKNQATMGKEIGNAILHGTEGVTLYRD